jgi:hypothetical protein
MANKAQRKWNRSDATGKLPRKNDLDEKRLKILRLDLHTILSQIKILEHELDVDPCLSTEGINTILSLADALKQELEEVRLHIRELKGSTEVQYP